MISKSCLEQTDQTENSEKFLEKNARRPPSPLDPPPGDSVNATKYFSEFYYKLFYVLMNI